MDLMLYKMLGNLTALHYLIKVGSFSGAAFLCAITAGILGTAVATALLSRYLLHRERRTSNQVSWPLAAVIVALLIVSIPLFLGLRFAGSRVLFANAFVAQQCGEKGLAVAGLRMATDIDGRFDLAYSSLMETLWADQRYDEALRAARRYAESVPKATSFTRLAEMLTKSGRPGEAVEWYLRAMSADDAHAQEIRLGLAHALFETRRYRDALDLLGGTHSDVAQVELIRARALFMIGDLEGADVAARRALEQDPSNWDILVILGRVLVARHEYERALPILERAAWLRRELPEAYVALAEVHYALGDILRSKECLEQAVYYDNGLSAEYVALSCLRRGLRRRPADVKRAALEIAISPGSDPMVKGAVSEWPFEIAAPDSGPKCCVQAVEPYGFGIRAEISSLVFQQSGGNRIIRGLLRIEADRDCAINGGKPWMLNLIVFDSLGTWYDGRMLPVRVVDRSEGKILFVVSEDLEINSDYFHTRTGETSDGLSWAEARIDIPVKGEIADRIANGAGARWSHMVDIGSAWEALKWASEQSLHPDWSTVWRDAAAYYRASIVNGNDVQLHLHAYNMPKSRNSHLVFNKMSDTIQYGLQESTAEYPFGHGGAWAYYFTELGDYQNPDSRMGSVFHGISVLEALLTPVDPSYRTLVFRAGEYEFGATKREMRDSISSLIKNQIICSSNATSGAYDSRQFSFARPAGQNAYLSCADDITQRADDIKDAGLLEVTPIPKLGTLYYLRPVDNGVSAGIAYNVAIDQEGLIAPGVRILMEAYHMYSVNASHAWDSTDTAAGDWRKIAKHFNYVKAHCAKIKFATFTEAALTYLDYYAPDVMAIRTHERRVNSAEYEYDVDLIGRDIRIDQNHPHFCVVKPPSTLIGRISRITIGDEKHCIAEWESPADYDDLRFTLRSKGRLRMRVYLRTSEE